MNGEGMDEECSRTSTILSLDPSSLGNVTTVWEGVSLLEQRDGHVAGVHGECIIVAGGQTKDNEATSSVEIFHRSNGKFTPAPSMTQKRVSAAAALLGQLCWSVSTPYLHVL